MPKAAIKIHSNSIIIAPGLGLQYNDKRIKIDPIKFIK